MNIQTLKSVLNNVNAQGKVIFLVEKVMGTGAMFKFKYDETEIVLEDIEFTKNKNGRKIYVNGVGKKGGEKFTAKGSGFDVLEALHSLLNSSWKEAEKE